MKSEKLPQTYRDMTSSRTTPPIHRNLVLVARRQERYLFNDFCEIAAYCREMVPDVRPIPLFDTAASRLRKLIFIRPTLTFVPRRLLFYHPLRGTVRSGKLLPKKRGVSPSRGSRNPGPAVAPAYTKTFTRRHRPRALRGKQTRLRREWGRGSHPARRARTMGTAEHSGPLCEPLWRNRPEVHLHRDLAGVVSSDDTFSDT